MIRVATHVCVHSPTWAAQIQHRLTPNKGDPINTHTHFISLLLRCRSFSSIRFLFVWRREASHALATLEGILLVDTWILKGGKKKGRHTGRKRPPLLFFSTPTSCSSLTFFFIVLLSLFNSLLAAVTAALPPPSCQVIKHTRRKEYAKGRGAPFDLTGLAVPVPHLSLGGHLSLPRDGQQLCIEPRNGGRKRTLSLSLYRLFWTSIGVSLQCPSSPFIFNMKRLLRASRSR